MNSLFPFQIVDHYPDLCMIRVSGYKYRRENNNEVHRPPVLEIFYSPLPEGSMIVLDFEQTLTGGVVAAPATVRTHNRRVLRLYIFLLSYFQT